MSYEFCPNCKTSRNMVVTKIKKKIQDKKGKEREIIIFSYHCEDCNTFVRSEEPILENLIARR